MIELDKKILKQLHEYDDHDSVYLFYDANTGLKGFVALHNLNLGPATGGTRFYSYNNEVEALRDVLNLSKAMTYKCALAGVGFGGGKAVIIGDQSCKNINFFKKYGENIQSLGGKFTTGTDVGISDEDTKYMALGSEFILGQKNNGFSTSDMAALGVFFSIKKVANNVLAKSLSQLSVAIKGVGKLGGQLALFLAREGSKVYISDVNRDRVIKLEKLHNNILGVENDIIHKLDVDVYSPCALGNEFDEKNITELKAKTIIGGANNQLKSDGIGYLLHNKGVLYAPDYVVNAGGLISIVDELNEGGYSKGRVLKKVENIGNTLLNIIEKSAALKKPTFEVADMLAREIIYK